MRGNAFELNPTFGLDCVEQRREVSSLRSRDLEWFELGEQKRGFPFSSPASRSFFPIKKLRRRREVLSALTQYHIHSSRMGLVKYHFRKPYWKQS